MTKGKRLIRTTTNVRDLETEELVMEGTELELEPKKAERWVDLGVAEFVVTGKAENESEEVMESG